MNTITDPNPGIFMRIVPIEEVLASESIDQYSYEDAENTADVLVYKMEDEGFPELLESIRTHGLAKGFEPCYRGYMGEGHHRLAALYTLGAKWCPVNDGYDPQRAWVAPDGTKPGECAHCPGCDRWDGYW
jgi:hypothetical protein